MDVNRPGFPRLANVYTLLLVCLGLYLPLFWQLPLIRGEGMYALIPQEMLAAGSWLTPTLNGVPYLDKPHLLYWLNIVAYQIFGVSDWAARVATLAVTVGEVWLTYLIGVRLLGRQAAWLGGFVLLSSIGFFALHLQIFTDHLITLFLGAALYGLLRWQEKPTFAWAALFYLALVAGFLSKGFIGVVFPVTIGLLYAWGLKQPRVFPLFWSPQGLTLALILVIPWFIGVEQANPGFLKFQIVNEQIMRFLGQRQPPDIIPFPIPGFWLFLGIWLLPWTLLLPEALYRFWQSTRAGAGTAPAARLLLIWALVILGFFTLSSSRIEYYSLPAFPPLALVLGWRLHRYLAAPESRTLFWALVGMGLLGLALLFLLPHLEQIMASNRREMAGMVGLLAPVARAASITVPVLALLGLISAYWKRPRLAVAAYGVLALALVLFTFQALLLLSPRLSDKLPGLFLRKQASPQDIVVLQDLEEFEYAASLAFYARHQVLIVKHNGMPQFPYPVDPAANYLISPACLAQLWRGPDRVFLLQDTTSPAAPAPPGATVAFAAPGKRLLVNHP